MNFLSGRAIALGNGGLTVDVPGVGALRTRARARDSVGKSFTLGVRPEHIALGTGGENVVTGKVAGVEQLGGLSTIRLAEPALVAQVVGQTALRLGDSRELHLAARDDPRVRRRWRSAG